MKYCLTPYISAYMIVPPNEYHSFSGIEIKKMVQADGRGLWAAYLGGSVLSKSVNAFVCDTLPSNRDKNYENDCRFEDLDSAVDGIKAFVFSDLKGIYFKETVQYMRDSFPQELL